MNSLAEATLESWTFDPALLSLLLLTGLVYCRGWFRLRLQKSARPCGEPTECRDIPVE